MTRAGLCVFAFIVCIAGAGAAEPPASVLRHADEAYARGDFAAAADGYRELAARGYGSAVVEYNLGNACFRQQRIGEAALHFERAARLAPRDPDIRHNLRHVRSLVKEPEPEFPGSLLAWLLGLASLNELLLGAALLLVGTGAAVTLFILRRSGTWLAAGAALALGCIVCGGWLALKLNDEVWTDRGVMLQGTEARNAPGAESSVAFALPEGRRVLVLGQDGDWVAVGVPHEGVRGWAPRTAIGRVARRG